MYEWLDLVMNEFIYTRNVHNDVTFELNYNKVVFYFF